MQHASTLFGRAGRMALVSMLAMLPLPTVSMAAGAPPLWQTEVITLISHQRYKEAGETLRRYCVEQHNAELCLMLASAHFDAEAQLGIDEKDIVKAYEYTRLACDYGSAAGCAAYKAAIEKGELLRHVLFEPGIADRDAQLKEAVRLGADLNATALLSATLLQEAISEEKTDAVKLLLENGVDVNYRVTEEDPTPLMYAINTGNPELVSMLLDKGADATRKMRVPTGLDMGSGLVDACGFAERLQQQELMRLLRCDDTGTAVE